ncbi:hypothetical protein [Tenuifilum thalassicum]|uniref:Tetratricopeptide repeat protein n=1 Tax=Tenuifilum thalassicum TaxID=2590900 RepID=A0A7D4BY61_9BACT|nr:hypothetical protein [Tenuifilum thalassicum]QKG78864.1 hypothetical protein FHG85_00800 [Tenuifilum thalassicum]
MRFILLTIISFVAWNNVLAQEIIQNPFSAELSHPELNVDQIALYPDSTVINFTVINNADKGGWFCADKNIYIEVPETKKRYYRTSSRDIPTCPSVHNFSKKGEKLSFTLVFPSIPQNLHTINIIEDCNKACFFFKGLILSNKLNNDIRTYDQAMKCYAKNNFECAIDLFTKVLDTIPKKPTHVYGYAFYHLIMIHNQKGDKLAANFWLSKLKESTLPNKEYFIDMAKRDAGIK